ncbi:hypothetical protein [Caminicella sporogenes]|nr:hypothetical protein [Caminicella sporogenes]
MNKICDNLLKLLVSIKNLKDNEIDNYIDKLITKIKKPNEL